MSGVLTGEASGVSASNRRAEVAVVNNTEKTLKEKSWSWEGFKAKKAEFMNPCKVAAAGCALALGAEAVVGGSALATAGATLPVAAGVSELTVQACTGAAVICGVAGAEKPYDHLTSPPPTTLPQEVLGTGNGTEFLPSQAGEDSSSSTTTPSMAPQAGASNAFASGQDGEAEGEGGTSLAGQKLSDVVKGYTKHGVNQAIGRNNGKGVDPEGIVDAVKNPSKIVEQAGEVKKYVGEKATVIVSKDGKIITTYGKPRAK